MSTNVLAARDINTSAPHASNRDSKPTMDSGEDAKSMEYHRQILHSKLAEDGQKTTYISPSDTIMSPTTQKLAGMRQKRFMKAKPQSLFAKTSSKNMLSPTSSTTANSGLDGVLNDSITTQSEKKGNAGV
ncbi:hypothetical protein MMC18_001190 [Xylographa bjoerkii]|nr:hypothetical protein [Xylographa bjoerkii]